MDKELEAIIKSFLSYSFTDISFKYENLTESEKKICSWEQFQKLVAWVRGEGVPDQGIEPYRAAL